MPLEIPKIDDRRFQDIVDEVKKHIPYYTEEWTAHNVSDPGITLIELFAWMTEIILFRINRLPETHAVKLMEMLGVRLHEAAPATAAVTFYLDTPQNKPSRIPRGTEIGSAETENEPAIIFTTIADFHILPPQIKTILTASADDALYLGFANDLSHHLLRLGLDLDPEAETGPDPARPPYVCEALVAGNWQVCQVEMGTTSGLHTSGAIDIHLPQLTRSVWQNERLYWLRLRINGNHPDEQTAGRRPDARLPQVRRSNIFSVGATIPAVHAQTIQDEFLGESDGSAGQRFRLQGKPVLSRQEGETLTTISPLGESLTWTEVADFADSSSHDRHFTLSSATGELRLAPAIRHRDGAVRLFAAIPPVGAKLYFRRYRVGGGIQGNVGAGTINRLRTPLDHVVRVTNREPAWGGLDAETLDEAQVRLPALLRSRNRAVTPEDFEFLAYQAFPTAIARVKCLQSLPDADPHNPVRVLVIPRTHHRPGMSTAPPTTLMPPSLAHLYLPPDQLRLPSELVHQLRHYLDERRLLTTRLEVREPAYQWVSVKVIAGATHHSHAEQVKTTILQRLYQHLHPTRGGHEGTGWPFGRTLHLTDIYRLLAPLPEITFIKSVELYSAEPSGERTSQPLNMIELPADSVIASAFHEVEIE